MNAVAALPQLLTEAQAAAQMGICVRSLRKIRKSGGIEYVLIGSAIRYSMDDIARFIDERRIKCPSKSVKIRPSGTQISPSTISDIASARVKRNAAPRK